MTYKRYIKKKVNGKVKIFGPYYCESYRDKDGKVKTRYLGIPPGKNKSLFNSKQIRRIIGVSLLFLFLFFGLFILNQGHFKSDFESGTKIGFIFGNFLNKSYSVMTGFVTEDIERKTESESDEEVGDEEESEEVVEIENEKGNEEESGKGSGEDGENREQEQTNETGEDVAEEDLEIAEEDEQAENQTIVIENETQINQTIANETIANETIANETIANETIANETIANETIANETILNETLINETILNETLTNRTILNESLVNESFINETVENETEINESLLFVTTKQYKAVIGRPVKWIKIIKVNKTQTNNLSLELPKDAKNISILTDDEISEALDDIEKYEDVVNEIDKKKLVTGVITGYVSLDIDESRGFLSRFFNWLKGWTISGNVILEENMKNDIAETESSKIVNLTDAVKNKKEVAVEYWTPGPVAVEKNISKGKRIIISAPDEFGYEDILAYTLVSGFVRIEDTRAIKLYHYIDEREELKRKLRIEKLESEKNRENDKSKTEIANETIEDDLGEENKSIEEINETEFVEENKFSSDFHSLITGTVIGNIDRTKENESFAKKDKNNISNFSKRDNFSSQITKKEVNFSAYDLDSDGYIDYIEWVVPHLSNQTYEVVIEVLNVQSYPTVGGNWTVRFNTSGTANLMIRAINGTTIGFERMNNSVDLEFLELKCGEDIKNIFIVLENERTIPYDIYLKKKRIEEIRRLLGS